jgi:hypothetical protein
MRRCQRLPEVTHPGDPTRLLTDSSIRMPGSNGSNCHIPAPFRSAGVLARGHGGGDGGQTLSWREDSAQGAASVGVEIAIGFPGRDVSDVAVPFFPFRRNEVIEDVISERLAHQVVLLELIERFT